MNLKTLRIILQIVGSIVAIAWLIDSTTQERGFISTYLAPFAFGPLIIAAFMAMNEKRRVKTASDKIAPHHDSQSRK